MRSKDMEKLVEKIKDDKTVIEDGCKVDGATVITGSFSFDGSTNRLKILEQLPDNAYLLHCPGSTQQISRFDRRYIPASIYHARIIGDALQFSFVLSGYGNLKKGIAAAKKYCESLQ